MRYTLIHDLTDSFFTYTLVDENFTAATSWAPTLPKVFDARTIRTESTLSLFRSIVTGPITYPDLITTTIDLDEFSFGEFSSKYPEFLI